ncbi:MAG TPA: hypothetical protein VIK89_00595 [Cytophagaceae bacterium]
MKKLPDKTYFILLFLISFALYGLRIWKLEHAGLYDYDSVKNYQIAREILEGNFANLYHHASPFFNFYLALLVFIFKGFLFPEYINAAISLLSLFVLIGFVKKEYTFDNSDALLLYLLAGTSLTLVNSSRYLAIEGLTLLFSILVIKYFYLWVKYDNKKKLYIGALFFGVLMVINYKALLLFPIFILFLFASKPAITIRQLIYAFLMGMTPFLLLMLTGVLLNQSLFQYPKVLAGVIFRSGVHPEKEVGLFNFDWLFYFKYFFYYENPFLIPVLLLFPVIFFKQLRLNKDWLLVLVTLISYCFLFGMSLLQKAPRGLLIAYPFMYLMMYLLIKAISKNYFITSFIVIAIVILNITSIVKNIYPYSYTFYPQMAEEIRRREISEVASTVSNRIYPFISSDSVHLKVLLSKQQLKDIRSKYIIDDAYWKITGITFDTLSNLSAVASYKEPAILSPLFLLEHAEFSGMSFSEVLDVRDSLLQKEYHIRLIELD